MSVAEELIDAGYDADAINRMPLLKNAYTIDSIREALTSCGIEDDDIENVIEYLTDWFFVVTIDNAWLDNRNSRKINAAVTNVTCTHILICIYIQSGLPEYAERTHHAVNGSASIHIPNPESNRLRRITLEHFFVFPYPCR